MKKLFSILLLAVCTTLSASAQHRMIVDPKVVGYISPYAQNVYDATVESLYKVGFIQLITSESQGVEEADYEITIRLNEIIDLPKRSDDDFKYRYKVPFQLSLTRLSDKTVIGSQSFHSDGYSDESVSGAVQRSIERSMPKIVKFINEKLPCTGELLEITEADGNKAKTLYISLGSKVGIRKGQELEVKVNAMAGGRPYLKSLGKVKVEEVEGVEGSRCKVTDGHEKILKAYTETPEKIVVITTKDWGIGDWWESQ